MDVGVGGVSWDDEDCGCSRYVAVGVSLVYCPFELVSDGAGAVLGESEGGAGPDKGAPVPGRERGLRIRGCVIWELGGGEVYGAGYYESIYLEGLV